MTFTKAVVVIIVSGFIASPALAQTGRTRRTVAPRATSTRVIVHEMSGTPIPGVHVTVLGGGGEQATTDAGGVATVKLGRTASRIRFERQGFITLEREIAIGTVPPAELEVALNAAPPPPPPPPPPPSKPQPQRPVATSGSVGPPTSVSIPTFLDKNFIGREAYKESILGCTPDATARLLQVREPLADHASPDADEVLYVVAGQGVLRMGDHAFPLEPGSVSVIPRGVTRGIERRGRTPLVMLSTTAGVPCPDGAGAPPRGR